MTAPGNKLTSLLTVGVRVAVGSAGAKVAVSVGGTSVG